MSKNSSFKAALARQVSEKVTSPAFSDFPTVKVLLRNVNITRPADVAHALKDLGLSLRKPANASIDTKLVETSGP